MAGFESSKILLDRQSEKAFLLSRLKVLEIPAMSQMLVHSHHPQWNVEGSARRLVKQRKNKRAPLLSQTAPVNQ